MQRQNRSREFNIKGNGRKGNGGIDEKLNGEEGGEIKQAKFMKHNLIRAPKQRKKKKKQISQK